MRPSLILLIYFGRNTGLPGILILLWDIARFLQRAVQRSQKNPMSSCKTWEHFSGVPDTLQKAQTHSSWGGEQVGKKRGKRNAALPPLPEKHSPSCFVLPLDECSAFLLPLHGRYFTEIQLSQEKHGFL